VKTAKVPTVVVEAAAMIDAAAVPVASVARSGSNSRNIVRLAVIPAAAAAAISNMYNSSTKYETGAKSRG
jgi:hypothetical protein